VNNNEWLDIDVLEDYLDGKLDAKTMHRVERLSLEDPFVAEALAGLSLSPKRTQSLSLLQKQLQDRIAQKPVEEKRWQITSQRLSIAAAAAVLFVTVSLLFWMRESSNREKIAANTPKKVEVSIAARKQPDKAVVKPAEQVEKVINEITADRNVANSKKITQQASAAKVSPHTIIEANELQASDFKELTSIKAKQNVEAPTRSPSALSGKVAGLQLNRDIITGVVYGDDKLPITGASVKLKGTSQGATTDSKGQFSLKLDSILKNPTLNVAYLGFLSKEVPVKKAENLAIELKQDHSALNEVVITGVAAKKERTTASAATILRAAEPLGGWEKFEEYMLNNNRLLVNKKQTGRDLLVDFTINRKGEPVDIKIGNNDNLVPQPTQAEKNEAIRLLKDGPKWFVPENDGSTLRKTSVNIRF